MSTPQIPRSHVIYTIAIIGFIYTLHLVIPMYSNSSFLSLFVDEQTVGLIYMTASALSILGFLIAPYIIRRFGNYVTALSFVCIQIVLFIGLVSSHSSDVIVFLFILQYAMVYLIGLTLDIFLEGYTNVAEVGSVRGLYNATLNASWVIAPLLGTLLIDTTENYHNTYIAGLMMLFPLLYLIHRNLPRFKDPRYSHTSPWQLIKHISRNKNWVRLFSANLILQTFYAWMTIYSVIYLNKTMGFSWYEIGIIIVVMLIPFPLVQYPLGKLSDTRYSIKSIMTMGLALMGISTIFLSFITVQSVVVWALALMVTRIGAAAAEIMMETYFFKTVSPKDSAVLGAFRITRPLSYFVAPAVTTIGLLFVSDRYLFVVVGILSLVAVYPALRINDRKNN